MSVKQTRPILGFFIAALMSACAGGAQPSGVSPADVSTLEAERARHPDDVGLITRLGVAYYDAKNYDHARDVFLSALALDKRNYTATMYLGLTFEALEMLDSARVRYTAASSFTTSEKQKDEIADRLALLTRKELKQSAQRAIAQEATLSKEPPPENTVAVFPFRYLGSNADLRPLERGLTHLVITDLSRVSRLRLLERERVQALVDELQLAEQGRVDPSTGARSGRLLRASRVVQGALQDVPASAQLQLDATVVNATSSTVVATGKGTDKLQQLFDLEKQVVLQLLRQMNITLTPAEQRAISERPTADLQAFLLFSQGLEAEDRGDFQAAQADFNAAVARDPNFEAAKQQQTQTSRVSSALQQQAPELAGFSGPSAPPGGLGGTLRNAIGVAVPSIGSQLHGQIGAQVPLIRPPLPEALRQDDPRQPQGLTGTIIIIITRP